jgi:hypothetical protein
MTRNQAVDRIRIRPISLALRDVARALDSQRSQT